MQVQFPIQQDEDSCQVDQMETNSPCTSIIITNRRSKGIKAILR